MTSSVINAAASSGFHNAAAYDAHRPSYPPTAVEALLSHIGVSGQVGAKIVDLAAGTGKFTEVLVARPEKYEIRAVEPLQSMRETLAAKGLERVDVQDGMATKIGGVEDGWADAVIVAQAFHWFSTQEALAEISRTLKPGGKVGLVWNIEDYNQPRDWEPRTNWLKNLKDMILSIDIAGPPRFRSSVWQSVFEQQANNSDNTALVSTPIGEAREMWTVWLTKDALWDRINTLSQVVVLQGQERVDFKAQFDRVLQEGDGEWNDKGEIALHGATFYAWTKKL